MKDTPVTCSNSLRELAWVQFTPGQPPSQCRISYEHARCSYGLPVLIYDGKPLGPADILDGRLQHHGPHKDALRNAGFDVVEHLDYDLAAIDWAALEDRVSGLPDF